MSVDLFDGLGRFVKHHEEPENVVARAMAEAASKVESGSLDDPLDYAFLKLAASQYHLDRAMECLRNAEQCLTKLAYAMKEADDE